MNIALNIAFRLSCIIISAFLFGNVYQGQRTGSLYSGYVKVNKVADPIGFWLGYCVSLVGSAAVFAAAIIGP